ncbi:MULTISPECIES: hypothetical protein [unclassified Rhodococcus (in: high G+C Gram-positive bacteria)]|uniref:hypothetical protein n=1 Tax=unclassified Rhodococcus (in: high G+C Gram-positive bacteria) TaxID=192944 RepID=UPI0024B83113|nr:MULTISPECIES: hypothetical protein [unclassified Rhodococcus (in: high G+C Gram-positive bacteria)]MDI9960737.1 hypothetical protein [Rhodococcus sp. IEGM 1237]MDI9966831.1 hypothetical protein [Rhodococcus sp. IEGM 1251]MDV8129186.1 hypothetical protein [Rhodococcus sp. IEGM 1304]
MPEQTDGNFEESRGQSTPKAQTSTGKTVAITLGVVLVVGMLIFGGAFLYNKSQVDELKDAIASSAPSATSGGAIPKASTGPVEFTSDALDAMSLQDFRVLDSSIRVGRYAGKLDEWSTDSLAFMQKHLSPEQARLVNQPLPEDKSSYTDQDILNSYSINLYDASAQGNSAQEIERGRKLLSVILDPQNSGFDKLANRIGNGQGGIISVYEASSINYPRIKNQSFMGEIIGESGAEIILGRGVEDGKAFLSLYELRKTDNGNDVWLLKTAYDPSDPKVRAAIEALPVQ